MPHHAPAENNAATTTRASTTLNPGRELPGADCVPQDAHTTETFDAERLNRLVK